MILEVTLKGTSPMSQSKVVLAKKKAGENGQDFEERTWRERMHTEDGKVFIPSMALKHALVAIARYRSESIPGKGKATFTKHFLSGVHPMELGATIDGLDPKTIEGEPLFVPSDGKAGGGKRVLRIFPKIPTGWTATFRLRVIDKTITAEKTRDYLRQAGALIGLGRWRPANGGLYGQFEVVDFKEIEE